MSFFNNLTIFFSIFITSYLTFVDAANINIQNNCSYTIWVTVKAKAAPGGGRKLSSSQKWDLNMVQQQGRIWAQTNCDGNKCESGGELYGALPINFVEYTINAAQNQDFFDISLVDGFSVPVEFSPTTSGCTIGVKCSADINRFCPTELRDPGGCNHPCTIFNNEQFCCRSGNTTDCSTTSYYKFFNDACPNVYLHPFDDDATRTFTCPTGTDYKVVFCP